MTDENTEGQQSDGASSPKADEQAATVAAIMEFDPFGPAAPAAAGSDDTGKEEGEGGEAGGEPSGQEPPKEPELNADGTPKEPVQPSAQTPTQQGPTQREQELLAQVAALQQAIQQSKPQEQQPDKGQQPAHKYNLGLPPQVIQGLRSENEEEFAVAMHAVVNGIANRLWTDMQEHLSKEYTPTVDQRISAVVQHGTQVRQVHDEFYGSYPHLKNPMLMPLVQNAALAVGRQWAASGKPIQWGKEFSDAVAALVHQVVPAPQQQQQQQPTNAQPKRQTFTARPGSRPAASPGNEFADIL